ncbi:MAG: YodL domain-containing protein [Candidatus Woesearchaeota archaeon]
MKIKIYQISEVEGVKICRECEKYHNERCLNKFKGFEFIDKDALDFDCYSEVYSYIDNGEYDDIYSLLNNIFYVFNNEHPIDFKGHSLSVSDVVRINDDFFFVDVFGFTQFNPLTMLKIEKTNENIV